MECQQGQQQIFKTITDFVSFFMKVGGIIGFLVSMISLVIYSIRINYEINIMNANLRKDINSGFERIDNRFDLIDREKCCNK
ncbi:unnamed protein product [Rhizophagus irregularis]|uniref:Uncharacterized protein n=2 Tax=Rhizophagus irregularis TaxID=588596 RepID=A0A915ZP70_9GLOM|nr:unnamed protein product [Rhizophagus irregularis]CAB5195952.1 unnamed protein product [Rhizophagus irregularis]CAB5385441.1 unnamed protein product [Rhizophagus irregularis]